MTPGNSDDSGPFPKSVFPESVFPRRIFRWMGDDEETQTQQTPVKADRPKFPWEVEEDTHQDQQTPVKKASSIFPWDTEDDEQKTDSSEDLFDFAKWKIDK